MCEKCQAFGSIKGYMDLPLTPISLFYTTISLLTTRVHKFLVRWLCVVFADTCSTILGENGGKCPDNHQRKKNLSFETSVCSTFDDCMTLCCDGCLFFANPVFTSSYLRRSRSLIKSAGLYPMRKTPNSNSKETKK